MHNNYWLETFDLKSEEQSLGILIWTANSISTHIKNVTFIPELQIERLLKFSSLEYPDQSYDLSLCENTLFDDKLYSLIANDQKVIEAHTFILQELCRVAGEVRVYPITHSSGQPSKYLGPVLKSLQEKGLGETLQEVKSSEHEPVHAILKIFNTDCHVKKNKHLP